MKRRHQFFSQTFRPNGFDCLAVFSKIRARSDVATVFGGRRIDCELDDDPGGDREIIEPEDTDNTDASRDNRRLFALSLLSNSRLPFSHFNFASDFAPSS